MLLPETRTASPWICDFTFGNSSRMSFVIFLASVVRQAPPQADVLANLVAARRLDRPQSKILSDSPRRMAFDSTRSLIAAARMLVVGHQDDLVLPCSSSTVAPLKS